MHYVYVVYSPSADDLYYGQTRNLKRRIKEHKQSKHSATAQAADWQLIYYEAYQSKKDATEREAKLKQYGASLGHLKNRIKNSVNQIKER